VSSHPDAYAVIAGALARTLAPPARVTPTEWAARNLVVPDGPRGGEPWAPTLTPYIVEPLDMLGPESPVNEIAVMKSAQTGFALALNTPVATPSGWTTMGALKEGDHVFDDQGSPTNVVYASPVYHDHECYRVEFCDGSEIIADAGHLWQIESDVFPENFGKGRTGRPVGTKDGDRRQLPCTCVLDTETIARHYRSASGRNMMAVVNARQIALPAADLPVDPYVFGLWLGDGSWDREAITCHENDLAGYGFSASDIISRDKRTPHILHVSLGKPVRDGLKALGLLKAKKRIPDAYLRASADQRLALLRGLMDTDGSAEARSRSEFTNTNWSLANGVRELATSLGFKATIAARSNMPPRGPIYGEAKSPLLPFDADEPIMRCLPQYRVSVRMPASVNPFRIARKAAQVSEFEKPTINTRRRIVNVEKIASEPVRCISVDAPSRLFLAGENFIPTHNTTLLIAALGHSIDLDPCRMMVLQPNDATLGKFNREKLQPAIDQSKALNRKVAGQVARSGEGSTTYSKRYPGGSLTMSIASSAADLRSETVKKLFRDEIDEYPDDLDGQGDPLKLSDGRLTSFLASGEWKKADISTPTIKGASKIERRYDAGDQRKWNVPCPHCGDWFVFEFGAQFRYEKTFPHKAHYVAPCCGAVIWPGERDGLVRKGRWVALATRPGAFPSYHFDALSSPFVPWDEIAKQAIGAEGDPKALKSFYNLFLGLPYEDNGDGPGWELLLTRREDYGPRGHVPPQGLILTAAADVQMRGIWFEVVAWASDRQSWVVDAGYFDGSTESPDGEAFVQLAALLDRDWPDAHGGTRKLDALGVDSGYRSHVVYAWVREHQRTHPSSGQSVVLALKGWDGWGKPAIGTPSLVDIDLGGKKLRKGGRVWPIGTWPLKSAFSSNLEKVGVVGGAPVDPPGYCHFPKWADDAFFRQITAEVLTEKKFNNRMRKYWAQRPGQRDNHLLDCSVYCMALSEYLGMSSWTREEIEGLSRERGLLKDELEIEDEQDVEPEAEAADPVPADQSKPAEPINERLLRLMQRNAELFR
jgi:phage terminase large subunit GpA-like protein